MSAIMFSSSIALSPAAIAVASDVAAAAARVAVAFVNLTFAEALRSLATNPGGVQRAIIGSNQATHPLVLQAGDTPRINAFWSSDSSDDQSSNHGSDTDEEALFNAIEQRNPFGASWAEGWSSDEETPSDEEATAAEIADWNAEEGVFNAAERYMPALWGESSDGEFSGEENSGDEMDVAIEHSTGAPLVAEGRASLEVVSHSTEIEMDSSIDRELPRRPVNDDDVLELEQMDADLLPIDPPRLREPSVAVMVPRVKLMDCVSINANIMVTRGAIVRLSQELSEAYDTEVKYEKEYYDAVRRKNKSESAIEFYKSCITGTTNEVVRNNCNDDMTKSFYAIITDEQIMEDCSRRMFYQQRYISELVQRMDAEKSKLARWENELSIMLSTFGWLL